MSIPFVDVYAGVATGVNTTFGNRPGRQQRRRGI